MKYKIIKLEHPERKDRYIIEFSILFIYKELTDNRGFTRYFDTLEEAKEAAKKEFETEEFKTIKKTVYESESL